MYPPVTRPGVFRIESQDTDERTTDIMNKRKAQFIAYMNGERDCRACPDSCSECNGEDCECYAHGADAPTDAEMQTWLAELGKL